jgi:SAM-dependent methyltransferase/uncharacterized protein YbaR (Trm112 family)
MRKDIHEKVPLVCPACRAASEGAGEDSPLLVGAVDVESPAGELVQGTLACADEECGREYPVVDGIPLLLDDVLAYAKEERAALMRRADLTARNREVLELALDDEDEEHLRGRDLATYLAAHFAPPDDPTLAPLATPLGAWVEDALARHAPANARLGLDAGCATGGFTLALSRHVGQAVGVELGFDLARAARERVPAAFFAVASAEELPFERGAFDVVLALNLLDAIARPRLALRRLDACLRPGGLLLVTTPFAYETARTAPEERLLEEELPAFLAGAGRGSLQPGYEVLDDRPRVPWLLPLGPRRFDLFLLRCVAARKKARR